MQPLNIGHYVLGIEGLALLRTWIHPERGAADARVQELASFAADRSGGPLAYRVPIPEQDVTTGYTQWAATYDAMPNPLIQVEEPIVRRAIDALAPGVALDAACGTGRHTAYLLERGHRVVAVDATQAMLEQARQRASAADLRVGALEAIPLDDGSVDASVCALALTHVADLRPAIRELARVTRRGGRVILSDQHPMMEMLGGSAFYVSADGGFAYVTTYYHPISSYLDAFSEAGLGVMRCDEPCWTATSVATMLASGGLGGIADDAFRGALVGMPSALVWVLIRS
jgi:ubiquinone/menaquinone biosynthesis C-methylase UbiE